MSSKLSLENLMFVLCVCLWMGLLCLAQQILPKVSKRGALPEIDLLHLTPAGAPVAAKL